jgi:hypothetical protein
MYQEQVGPYVRFVLKMSTYGSYLNLCSVHSTRWRVRNIRPHVSWKRYLKVADMTYCIQTGLSSHWRLVCLAPVVV